MADAAVSGKAPTTFSEQYDGGGLDEDDSQFGASLRGEMVHGAQQRPVYADWTNAHGEFSRRNRRRKLGRRFV